MKAQSLIRLDASPYQRDSFFKKEQELARDLALTYLYADQRNRKLSWPLPPEYRGPFILLSNTHTDFKRLPHELLESTELLIHVNSGYDNINKDDLESWSFPVILGNPVRAPAVSEYILGHLFERFSYHVHQSHWAQGRHWERPLLKEKNILIIGGGVIGKTLEASLNPLANKVTVFDPYVEGKVFDESAKEELREHLISHSVVLMACGLNSRNHKMLGKRELELLPKDFVLINPARGGLIDENELISILQRSPKAYAILDVFENEPFEEQFDGLGNIHLTSHIAGVSSYLQEHMISFEKKVIEDFSNDKSDSKDYFINSYSHLLLKNRLIEGELI